MVNAPHWVEEAWKFPFSTCRYRVDTVCDLNRLNRATFVPLAIHTEIEVKVKDRSIRTSKERSTTA